ncbi:MAG: iron ABC transporter substrate-binding protein [Cereibacter sphaeroides]|uniref:Iron ABC transporter substrate-binding protein n=1 Tax=Cereibacter sphaeroides TaxID=1063 RepID=A0A2W5U8B1_CERSP|nr:MAG: iron ABC transporter substrate-binding protein [Cereibacter sphaeroides]
MRPLILALTILSTPVWAEDVNIYSFNQSERMDPLFDAFTAKTGIDVNIAYVDKGIERLVAEGDRSPADVIMAVDMARLAEIAKAGVLQPVQSPAIDAAIPPDFRDPGGLWTAITTRARIVYAAKDRVAPGEVTTYEALVDPKWKGRICTRSGLSDYNLALTAAMIAHHGADYTKTWLEGIKANLARPPQGNDRDQAKAIFAGECDIALGNTYYIGQMMDEPDERPAAESLRLDFPVFEGGGTHVNISGIGMTKSAPNKENALKLMEFLVSPEGQKIYAEINNEFPLLKGVELGPVMQAWPAFTPDPVDLMEIAGDRPKALKLMDEVDFDN